MTLDVCALYTNISHEEGIDACRDLLNTRYVLVPPTNDIINTILLILKMNNFSFDGNHYLQKKATDMGTHTVPSYTNIVMDSLETKVLASMEKIPSTWWR